MNLHAVRQFLAHQGDLQGKGIYGYAFTANNASWNRLVLRLPEEKWIKTTPYIFPLDKPDERMNLITGVFVATKTPAGDIDQFCRILTESGISPIYLPGNICDNTGKPVLFEEYFSDKEPNNV